jgi:hypothetical protein
MKSFWLFVTVVCLCPAQMPAEKIPLTDPRSLELRKAQAESVTYHGRKALKLMEQPPESGGAFAVLRHPSFHDGTIEVDLAGVLSKTADESARGFIGIAFRMQPDGSHYECIYIRPTNGRAQDQLRRNHATQYVSSPDWPWDRLRKESPGVYESYADMAEGEWIHMKIVVHGKEAALYLAGAEQPCLLVHDLKLGDAQGAVALWGGTGTEGYFANLEISDLR